MSREHCWLPPIKPFPHESFNVDSYREYESSLYKEYRRQFWETHPMFEGKRVQVRRSPIIDGYEESFVHFTCKNYDGAENREPDFRRCERLHWIRPVIEHYLCKQTCDENCEGIKTWEEPYKNTVRVNFLFEEERYLVVLEKRESYCLLITAYYLDYENTLRKHLKKYEAYKKAEDAPGCETSPETPSTTGR